LGRLMSGWRAAVPLILLLVAVGVWGSWPRHELQRADEPGGRLAPLSSPYRNAGPGVAYVGDAACARCHREIAAAYRRHPMGRSMSPAAEATPEADGTVFEVGDLAYAIERRDGRVFHRETRRDDAGRAVKTAEFEARYALGSGTRGLSFLVERDGGLYQSPIAWYTQEKRWDLAPGYRIQNLHFDRPITLDCLFCHTNRVEAAAGRPPVFHGLAIGCERCHGPGELHARRPERVDGRDMTIVNPADLEPPALREAVCEQCHWQGSARSSLPGRSAFDYRPGLPFDAFVRVSESQADPILRRSAVGHVEQMRQSRCYRQSDGRLGCISCHDPHRLPEPGERVAYYRGRCLECHAEDACRLPHAARIARSPEDDCTACHMPRSPAADIAHTALTRHTIPRIVEAAR
jgi:hypothetical protein